MTVVDRLKALKEQGRKRVYLSAVEYDRLEILLTLERGYVGRPMKAFGMTVLPIDDDPSVWHGP